MTSQAVYCVSLQLRPSEENNIESIIDTSKSIGDSSGDACDISSQVSTANHPTQLSIATVSTANIETQQQQHQASNIILIRGARTENGQIILQNGHELLSLLNSGAVSISSSVADDDKTTCNTSTASPSILLHRKTTSFANSVATSKQTTTETGKFVLQSALKNANITTNQIIDTNSLSGNGIKGNTLQLHTTSPALKNVTTSNATTTITSVASTGQTATIPEGSIILQQRLNKNGTNDGPILLQTLKRIDKSPSILLFRNNPNSGGSGTCTLTTASPNVVKTTTIGNQIAVIGNNKDDDKIEAKLKNKTVPSNVPLGADGEPIKLPDNLESLPRADHFPTQRHRWNTNEEIAALLISFDKHSEWQSKEVRTRPKSGSMLLYSRKKVRYRRDGYCWKKRKDGKTTREDHMKLKVQGTECIYGCYVHSAILPTFHRRCYWLLQNPDIVLVHYLNVPYPDDNKMAVITPSLALWGDKKEWTKEELVCQLKPMFFSEDEPDATNEIEITTAETVEAIVAQLMEKQRAARQAALVKQLECGCPDSTCADGKSCSHPMRRLSSTKATASDKQRQIENNNNHVSSTTPNVLIGTRLYSRWVDRRGRDQLTEITNPNNSTTMHQLTNNGNCNSAIKDIESNSSIHFQVIPPTDTSSSINSSAGPSVNNLSNNGRLLSSSNSALTLTSTLTPSSAVSSQTSSTSTTAASTALGKSVTTLNFNQTADNQIVATTNNTNTNGTNNPNHNNQMDNGQQTNNLHHQQSIVNHGRTTTTAANHLVNAPIVTSTPPLVLSLSQIQSTSGSLFILNGQQQQFMCQSSSQYAQHEQQQQHHLQGKVNKDDLDGFRQENMVTLCPKLEAMDSSQTQFTSKIHANNTYLNISYEPQSNPSNILKDNSADDLPQNDSMAFFNETLELSQEDIQKTLSANMPMNANGNAARTATTLNDTTIRETTLRATDFIDDCCDEGNIDVVPSSVHDDDVFVNLDAFDMFVEFPELDLDAKASLSCATDSNIIDMVSDDVNDPIHRMRHNLENESNSRLLSDDVDNHSVINDSNRQSSQFTSVTDSDTRADLFNISDFSPEWAYPEGGIKVLVTGPWNQNSNYTVLFDSFPVPTTIVQSGVLRCYCPAHEVGLVTLQVACDGYVISNSCIFEYKSPMNAENGAACDGTTNVSSNGDSLYKFTLFNRLESIEERMQIKMEPSDSTDESSTSNRIDFEDYLVNYCQSLATKQWRNSSDTILSWAKSSNVKGMSLLHLAACLGYSRLVSTLLLWRSDSPNVLLDSEIDALSQDNEGFTPLMRSCAKGHYDTAILLCKWNSNALEMKNYRKQTAVAVAIENGFIDLSEELMQFETNRKESSVSSSIELNRSFMHSIYKNEKSELDETKKGLTEIINDIEKGVYLKSLTPNSFSQSNDYLESTLSPKSVESQTSCRSHDGVFLRPGEQQKKSLSSPISLSSNLPTMTSLLSHRLIKRTSIDSGINLDFPIPSYRSTIWSRSRNLSSQASLASTASGFETNDSFLLCDESITTKPQQPFSVDDESNQHLVNDDRSSADNAIDTNVFNNSDNNVVMQEMVGAVGDSDAKVLTLAEQIIAAMPERIKNESDDIMSLGSPLSDTFNSDTSGLGGLSDAFMEPLLDSLPSSNFDQDLNFELNDYRYHDVGTPCSSLSPASSGPLQSPASYSVATEPTSITTGAMNSPSPPPTTEDFTEFLHASSNILKPFEADFSNLTLTDREQRELYEAAKCIQKAYRSYKGRKKLEEQDKERRAAIVIQNYYRRYKQYAYYRQMTNAALIIQNGYRSYCEHKRFKKSQPKGGSNALNTSASTQNTQCLQNYYNKRWKQQQSNNANGNGANANISKEPNTSGPLKRTYSQRTQNQAARKIQQFMRQSKMNIWEDVRTLTTERTSRKREAGAPTTGGIPSKLAVSSATHVTGTCTTNVMRRSD
ncbi:calmodulin-binding transcription activator 1 isoform X2 [Contarinia nasturtii]|uniref:calmodulin-binding transcription activator 1 isoform X2 n=1 Tax=Contarinia nasturtii TaxID=265458 RepID=UPI0012D3AC82|nr:calmodulin-binding transcription activator 1 isoform X2 [Contarinia nasturtii]